MISEPVWTHFVEADDASRLGRVSPACFWGVVWLVVTMGAWAVTPALDFHRVLQFLTFLGFAGGIVGLRYPAIGIISLAFLCTLDPLSRNLLMGGGLLRFNTFNYYLLLVMLVGCPLLFRLSDIHTRLLQVLILLLLLGLLWTPNQKHGQTHVLNVITIHGMLFYVHRAARMEEIWTWTAIVCGLNAAVGTPLFYWLNPVYLDKNSLVFVSVAASFMLCFAYLVEERRNKLLSIGLLLLCLLNVGWAAASASRGGTLTSIACFFCMLAGTPKLRNKLGILMVAALIFAAVATIFPEKQAFAIRRFQRLGDSKVSLKSRTSGRSDLARGGLKIFAAHPWGVGTGGFGEHYAIVSVEALDITTAVGRARPAHTAWIKILAENGLPGFVLLLAFVFSFAIVGLFSRDFKFMMLGLLCTGAITVAFMSGEFQSKAVWLLAASTTVAMTRLRFNRDASIESETDILQQVDFV